MKHETIEKNVNLMMVLIVVAISIGSLDPCFSCTERMAVIDKDSGSIKVYKQEELLEMFIKSKC